MSFDAGAIEASLTVHLEQFNRDLDKAEERVRKFEGEKHQVKISAVFDTASMSRARKMFADLDQQISRDASMRLRTSPQGSVLGSLNALFSPHPVTGAPSAQQAGQQGLLGRMFNTPGAGGDRVGPAAAAQQQQAPAASAPSSSQPRDASGRFTATNQTQQNQQDQRTENMLQRLFSNMFNRAKSGDTSASGFGKSLASGIGPGILGVGMKASGMIGLGGSLLGALPAATAGLGALGIAGVGIGASSMLFKGVQSQITPLSQAMSQAQAAQAAATTPAQAKAAAAQVAGVQQQINQLNPALKSIYTSEQLISTTWQKFSASFAPVFAAGLSSFASVFTKLQPTLQGFFGNATKLIQPLILGLGDVAAKVLPLLGQAFAAVGPLMRPMLDGLGGLLSGILPGLITLLKGAQPAVNALFGGLGIIGKGLGQMFTAFAPVVKASATILNSLLSVLSAIFPIVGQLAAIFASSLAPVFAAFAQTIKSLLPFLTIAGKVLASLAGAILGDLVSAFTALAQLLTDISPGLKIFADVLSQTFTVLENSGVFAVIGNALEAIVKPLGTLINLLLTQLAPLIPVIITLVSDFANILVTLLAAGLTTILEGITWLVKEMPWLVPLIAAVTAGVWLFNAALAANPIGLVIIAIVALVGAITLLVTHWHQVWSDIKQWASDAWNFIYNGFGKYLLPLLGPVGLIALGAIELYKHWDQIWGDIKRVASDFYQWIWTDFGAKIANFITKTVPSWFDTGVSAIKKAWGAVEQIFKDPVNFLIKTVYDNGIERLWNDVMTKIGGPTLPTIQPLAAGGRIMSGTGPTADDVLIRASRGETVVSAAHSAVLAPFFAALGVPGYQGGGVVGDIISSVAGGSLGSLSSELLKFVGAAPGTTGDLATMFTLIPKKIISTAVHWALGQLTKGLIGGGGGSPSGAGPTANAALAKVLVPQWATGADWISWNNLEMREAGWNNLAMNPSSGAYGIAQALPYTKMPKLGWPPSAGGIADPAVQIMWMYQYILGRYGTPETAWGHELAFNWYGTGLDAIFNHPTVIGVGESGAEHVSVTPLASYGRKSASASDLDRLIAALTGSRPMIGTYQTAFYGTGDTAYALRELTRTLRLAELQATVVGQ